MSNPKPSKPFKKGDPRINRDGRPKNSTDLSALFRRIGAEVATKKDGSPLTGPDGKPMTVLEAIARQWAQNPRQQGDFVDRAYGKVATPVDLTSKGESLRAQDLTDDELAAIAARRGSRTPDETQGAP